jgi:hypothetical protein
MSVTSGFFDRNRVIACEASGALPTTSRSFSLDSRATTPMPNDFVVVDDEDPDLRPCHVRTFSRSSVPPSAGWDSDSFAPISRARSCIPGRP